MVVENGKWKCGSFDEGRTTQKCHDHRNLMEVLENGINRNVAVVIKVEKHINVIDVLV